MKTILDHSADKPSLNVANLGIKKNGIELQLLIFIDDRFCRTAVLTL